MYYRSTYEKVNRMYEAYKRGKLGQKFDADNLDNMDGDLDMNAHENQNEDLEIEEFMKNNEL